MITTVTFPGDPPCPRPWYKKINPLWWLGNDEQSAQGNTFYYRYIRNPFQNFRWYVIGVVDRPHKVIGRASGDPDRPLVNKRSDIRPVPESGFTWSFIYVFGIPLLPWVSWAYRYFTFYFGWEPNGGFGILVNFSNSDLR